MGTIQVRDNGTFTAKVRKAGYPAQSATFPTRKEAERWITDTEATINAGRFQSLDNTALLRDIIDRYLKEVTPSKKGAQSEEWRLKAIQRDSLGSYSVGKLTPAVVANWRDRRLSGVGTDKPVSGGTVNREMNLLHHVLETARKEWGIGAPVNPVSEVRRPKSNPHRERRLTDTEKKQLLAACRETYSRNGRKQYLADVLELALETGMRQGEIVNLEIERVHLADRFVSLKAGGTKTDEARTVPLSTRAYEILRDTIGDRKDGRVWIGLTSDAVKRAFARARDKAGIKDVTFHDSRHDATTRFVELGLTDTEVMSITGHKTQSMMRRYTHLRAKDLAKKLG
ncbi:integrase [Burkholderia ubonensis]|uniref:tyrosine-type recombinase/integrase n=1 Tax=Burkholderia ubonensis TaxID=101571 RepID=UPI000758401B|nr:site-specific integrase [Burkholderia ubonensis]KVM61736.1 integrase [Burkholderia ubonensis]